MQPVASLYSLSALLDGKMVANICSTKISLRNWYAMPPLPIISAFSSTVGKLHSPISPPPLLLSLLYCIHSSACLPLSSSAYNIILYNVARTPTDSPSPASPDLLTCLVGLLHEMHTSFVSPDLNKAQIGAGREQWHIRYAIKHHPRSLHLPENTEHLPVPPVCGDDGIPGDQIILRHGIEYKPHMG